MSAQEHLAQYGVSMEDAKSFIMANLASPSTIFNTCKDFDVTNEMIAEIYGGVTANDVRSFFNSQGFVADELDASISIPTLAFTQEMVSGLTVYHHDGDVGNGNLLDRVDGCWKSTFNADGTVTDALYVAPFESTNWTFREFENDLRWSYVNGTIVFQPLNGNSLPSDTFTLVSQTATAMTVHDQIIDIDDKGTVDTSDDTTYELSKTFIFYTDGFPVARTEAEVVSLVGMSDL